MSVQTAGEITKRRIRAYEASYSWSPNLNTIEIKLKSPGYAALMQPGPLTLKEIRQEVVDADTLLLEYALGEEQSYLWAVTHDSMVTFRLPKQAEVEKAAQRVYGLLSLDSQQKRPAQLDSGYTEAASALSRIVLGSVAAHLGKRRLLI
jgi:hypothetical protein